MSRKLSKKEEGELVTKGFLYNDFIKEIDERIDIKISAQTGVLIEDLRDQLKGMMGAINMRFESMDRRFDRIETRLDDDKEWLKNHEKRISKLEYKGI
jgi:tetrahydromethanopterin S-methyltransferase subunit B